MTMTRALHPRTATAIAVALLITSTGCGGGSSDASSSTTAPPTTAATEPAPTTEVEPEPEPEPGITSDDLAGILPTDDQIGGTFQEVERVEDPSFVRLAMIDSCPGGVAITDEPAPDAVNATFTDEEGITISFELTPNAESRTEQDAQDLVDALNDCEFGVRVDEVLHSVTMAAGMDGLADLAIRGAVSDSLSSDAMPEPVGINTYFANIDVGDVRILIKGTDGFDGADRLPFDSDEMAPLAQEMVARVEGLS